MAQIRQAFKQKYVYLAPRQRLRVQVLAFLRIFVLFGYFLIINVFLISVCLVRPFHRNNVYLAGRVYASMTRILGMKIEYRIPDSVRHGGPYVFIGNHQNSFDLITVCGAAQPGMVTVGKKSLKWIPVFGWLYWLSGNILIDRTHRGRAHDTLRATIAKIKDRRLSVFFFPEGTRSYGRGLLPFKTGAFRIAKETREAIVMVNTGDLQNKINLNRWDNGTLIIELSEPEMLDDSRDIKEWADYFHQKMQKNLTRINAEVEQRHKSG